MVIELLQKRAVSRKRVEGVTIDEYSSLDLDDAVWLNVVKCEPAKLLVDASISDVAARVLKDSDEDKKAAVRGESRYHSKGHKPMLTRSLAEEELSLLPGVLRDTLTIHVALNDDTLEISEADIFRSVLRSRARLSYKKIAQMVAGGRDGEKPDRKWRGKNRVMPQMLLDMSHLAERLLARRRQRGALAIYDLNHGWTTTEDGQVIRLHEHERNIGYIIVQELMILANQAVASYLAERNIACLYRNHEGLATPSIVPDRDALVASIEEALASSNPEQMVVLAKKINLTMQRARYSTESRGHYGLALKHYLHFTSPIRRFSDLVNHRIVASVIEGGGNPYTVEELDRIAAHLNEIRDRKLDRKRKGALLATREKRACRVINEGTRALATASSRTFRDVLKIAAGEWVEADNSEAMTGGLQELMPETKEINESSETSNQSATESNKNGGQPLVVKKTVDPQSLIEALRERIERHTLAVKEALTVLASSPAEKEKWQPLKRLVLEWLRQNPPDAVSLFAMATSLKRWPAPSYSFDYQENARFEAIAVFSHRDARHEVKATGTSKKAAQQAAALKLWYAISEEPFEEAGQTGDESVESGQRGTDFISRLDFASVAGLIGVQNYTSALCELATRARVPLPTFEATLAGGEAHQPIFNGTLVLTTGEETNGIWKESGSGNSKQEARQRASANLIERLREAQIAKGVVSVIDEETPSQQAIT